MHRKQAAPCRCFHLELDAEHPLSVPPGPAHRCTPKPDNRRIVENRPTHEGPIRQGRRFIRRRRRQAGTTRLRHITRWPAPAGPTPWGCCSAAGSVSGVVPYPLPAPHRSRHKRRKRQTQTNNRKWSAGRRRNRAGEGRNARLCVTRRAITTRCGTSANSFPGTGVRTTLLKRLTIRT